MSRYDEIKQQLQRSPKTWLITGVAGFIGSNLLETLLKLDQTVVGLDNFATGHQRNLDEVQGGVTPHQWRRFKFFEGDVREYATCKEAVKDVDYVLHQAALGSVPRSISDPLNTNANNITGFLNMLHAAKEQGVESFTFAASSSTYGDHPALPKIEENIGNPLSPYAVTKFVNELYANVYARNYDFKSIGLRYFNVFGKRQDPNGAYAAVIPKWIARMILNKEVIINGDGLTSRDFCYIENTIQMNILAATAEKEAKGEIYNVAVGDSTSLNELYKYLRNVLEERNIKFESELIYKGFRAGDVRHSRADISKAVNKLGYEPKYDIEGGIVQTMPWYLDFLSKETI